MLNSTDAEVRGPMNRDVPSNHHHRAAVLKALDVKDLQAAQAVTGVDRRKTSCRQMVPAMIAGGTTSETVCQLQ